MKSKVFQTVALVCAGVISLAPLSAFAAYNDVTITTSALLSVGGYTLNITGTPAVVQSIVVNPSNFTVTLSSGSSIQISSPTYNQLSVDVGTFTQSNSCALNTSVLTLSSAGPSGSVTVTPLSTICSTTSSPTPTAASGANGPIVGNASGTLQTPAAYYASLKANVASSTVPSTATTPPSLPNIPTGIPTFTRTLKLGNTGSDVQALQLYLISKASGPAALRLKQHGATSYFGALTAAALKEFQKKVGIVPASGFFGPVTRTFVVKGSK